MRPICAARWECRQQHVPVTECGSPKAEEEEEEKKGGVRDSSGQNKEQQRAANSIVTERERRGERTFLEFRQYSLLSRPTLSPPVSTASSLLAGQSSSQHSGWKRGWRRGEVRLAVCKRTKAVVGQTSLELFVLFRRNSKSPFRRRR